MRAWLSRFAALCIVLAGAALTAAAQAPSNIGVARWIGEVAKR